MRTRERRYRVRQYDSVLGYFFTKKAAEQYVAVCTIDGRPARDMNAVIEFDRYGDWTWEEVA